MKPYYLKNAGEYHSRLTTKLAVLLLALPFTGAFAAEPDYATLVTASGAPDTIGTNTILAATLSGATVTAAGTATNLNTNVIGWAVVGDIDAQADLFWTNAATPIANAAGTNAPMTIGGTDADAAGVSSSYNSLTIQHYVALSGVTTLSIGTGGLDTGKVDADILGSHNALSLTGAGVTSSGSMIQTKLTTTGVVTLGTYGSSNTISITSGAALTSGGALMVGTGVSTDATAGSSNAITVSGKVSAELIGSTLTSYSTLTAVGATVGNYGSSNSVTVSDSGKLVLGTGALNVGVYGDSNTVSVTDGTVTLDGIVALGANSGSDSNKLTLSGSTLEKAAAATAGALTVGSVGSSNELTLSDESSIFVSSITVGAKGAADSETGLYTTTDASSNKLTSTASTIKTAGALMIGEYGSKNVVSLTGTGLYAAAADADSPADGLQLDELTAIGNITVGLGLASDSTHDHSALGSQNSLAFAGASIFKAADVTVGSVGSTNSLTLAGASLGGMTNLSIGAAGNSNTVKLSGASVGEVGGTLGFGAQGSSNVLTVEGGSSLAVTGAVTFGTGTATTVATTVNSAFGSSNVLTVDGEDSTLALNSATAFIIGDNGSNNKLVASNGAAVTIASSVTLGNAGSNNLGTILTPVRYFAEGNQINVSGGSSVTFSMTNAVLTVGLAGKSNSVTVTGEDSLLQFTDGDLVIGEGNTDSTAYGSSNVVTVSSGAVLIADDLYVGSATTNYGSNNSLIVSGGAIAVVNGSFKINEAQGDGNRLYLNDGMMAFKGKYAATDITWEEYILTGEKPTVTSSDLLINGNLVEQGLIKVWDSATSAYVTATASDLKVTYYSSEAEAEKATGYKGLAGYSVLTVATTNRLAWAGDVYDAGNNVYCSSWYGWFYNDAAYGDYIMSYNNYSWQYVVPTSTADSVFLYDYSLASWLYTDQTYFQNKWFYNYSVGAWQQIGL